MLGPLLFNLVPDSLVAAPRKAGCGVANDARVPVPLRDHVWSGAGTPPGELVDLTVAALSGHARLPLVSDLSHADIEASAARALDLADAARAPVRFQADDPVFLASSHGAAQHVLHVVARWATLHKAEFHIAELKTVAMVFATATATAALLAAPPARVPTAWRAIVCFY